MNESKRRLFFLIIFAFASVKLCNAQDTSLVHYLIKRIAEQQTKNDDYFLPGVFPSYISNKEKFSAHKKDNNIFFTGLIDYTLNEIKPYVNSEDELLIDSILANSKVLYSKFKNQKGRNTYNFWRTDSAHEYPYASFLKLFGKKITLPDDMDDTVLSLLALDANDSTAEEVHELMQMFVNSHTNKVRSVINEYNDLPAYSTWFGKKFP